MRQVIVGLGVAFTIAGVLVAQPQRPAGVMLADLTWPEAEKNLTPASVVVLPLGGAAVEHGPHLRLNNDDRIVRHLAGRVQAAAAVVVAPSFTYHFYPAFLEYPGSTHLRQETARDVVVDIVRSLARHGPKRFYVLNTGVSTVRALAQSAELLKAEGILLGYTDIIAIAGPAERQVRQQQRGTHADEIETSIMLYIAPDRVDMSRAVRDDSPQGRGGLTRREGGDGTYSKSGIWGDPTLATVDKGKIIVEAMVDGILREIAALRGASLSR